MTLATLTRRLGAAAAQASPAVALLSNKSWSQAMDDYGKRVSEVTAQRASLAEQRDAALLAGVSGDTTAERRADDLDNAVVALDRKLENLARAQAHAAERVAAKEAAERDAAERKRLAAVKRQVGAIHTKAHEAEKKLAELAAAMKEMNGEIGTLRQMIGPEMHGDAANFAAHMPLCVSAALNEADPLRFPKNPILAADRLTITGNAARCFDAEYSVGLAMRHKGVA